MYRTRPVQDGQHRTPRYQEGTGLDESRSPLGLRVPCTIGEQILGHLRAAAPSEGVGLVAVSPLGDDGLAEATCFYPGTNLDASPSRYTMDPAEVLAAFRDMEACGWRLGAIAHSHPVTAAEPSETDLREAHYRDALMLIVSLAGVTPVMRAWQVVPAKTGTWTVVEVPVMATGAEGKEAMTGWGRSPDPAAGREKTERGRETRGGMMTELNGVTIRQSWDTTSR